MVKALFMIISSLLFLALLCLALGWFSVISLEIAGTYTILFGLLDIFILGLTLLFFTYQINNWILPGYQYISREKKQVSREIIEYLGMEGHWFADPSQSVRFFYWVVKTLGVIVTVGSAYALYRFFIWVLGN